MKTRQDNNEIDCTGAVYVKNILNFCDRSNWLLSVTKTRYDNYVTDHTYAKQSYHDQFDRVWSVMKTRQDNDVTNCIDLIYVETETELLGLIWPGAIYCENHRR